MSEYTSDPVQITVTDMRTLLLLLGCEEPKVSLAAIEGLARYAEAPKNKLLLLNSNIIRLLLDCIAKPALKKAAITCLSIVTDISSTDIHQDMRRKDLMALLISIIQKEESVEIQDEAAFTLANIAKDFGNKADIRKAGGIKALVKLLESPDPDVKKSSSIAISNLLQDFRNRAEIRHANGIRPLLDLLSCEFVEVQENALHGLIQCSEDHACRKEMCKIMGIKRIMDYLALPSEHHHLTLTLLSNCLDEGEAASQVAEHGLPLLCKLLGHEDAKIKQGASIVISKACKTVDSQNTIRELGAITTLVTNLASSDIQICSSAACAIGAISRNEKSQIEILKSNALETLVKQLSHEQTLIKREAIYALAALCTSHKVRQKVKSLDPTCTPIKLLNDEDIQIVINATEFFSSLADDCIHVLIIVNFKLDLIKQGIITNILSTLEKSDQKIILSSLSTLSRFLMENDGQVAISKTKGISKIVEFLGHSDSNICKAAAYCIGNACHLQANAISACSAGAIEKLISLSNSTKNAANFAKEALHKILVYHTPIKYRIEDKLDADNIIADGFYDFANRGSEKCFPSITDLSTEPVDFKREILVFDPRNDVELNNLISEITLKIKSQPLIEQIKIIAEAICEFCGGVFPKDKVNEHPFKFRIMDAKIKLKSNAIPIGMIRVGTFYHRALLFKAICDKLSINPCFLYRGEYNRAWNVIDIKKLSIGPQEPRKETCQMVVDLMFEPGKLIPVGSDEANKYQRI